MNNENEILKRDGVYVPEDVGKYAFNLIWGTMDEDTKRVLEDDYKKLCPAHIPLWKYILYTYKFKSNIERKVEMKKIVTIEELIGPDLNQVSEAVTKLKKEMEQMQEVKADTNEISKEISNLNVKENIAPSN
jgi:hypothetical protein